MHLSEDVLAVLAEVAVDVDRRLEGHARALVQGGRMAAQAPLIPPAACRTRPSAFALPPACGRPTYGEARRSVPMQILTLYLSTALTFLVLDGLMLALYMKPLFTRHIGPLMLDNVRWAPAAVFYAAYVAGLVYLVSLPALKSDGPVWMPAAVIGALAYGTYEFTNYALMKGWTLRMVLTDVGWGTVLTAVSAWGGLALTRTIFKV